MGVEQPMSALERTVEKSEALRRMIGELEDTWNLAKAWMGATQVYLSHADHENLCDTYKRYRTIGKRMTAFEKNKILPFLEDCATRVHLGATPSPEVVEALSNRVALIIHDVYFFKDSAQRLNHEAARYIPIH